MTEAVEQLHHGAVTKTRDTDTGDVVTKVEDYPFTVRVQQRGDDEPSPTSLDLTIADTGETLPADIESIQIEVKVNHVTEGVFWYYTGRDVPAGEVTDCECELDEFRAHVIFGHAVCPPEMTPLEELAGQA